MSISKEIQEYLEELNDKESGITEESITYLLKQMANYFGMSNISLMMEVLKLQKALMSESDRGVALMAASFLDNQIEDLLRAYFVDDKEIVNNILTGAGALSSFYTRIELAYVLGLIGPKIRGDLKQIQKIRNDFAHSADLITFNSEKIISRCVKFNLDSLDNNQSFRDKYIYTILGMAGFILGVKDNLDKRPVLDDSTVNQEISIISKGQFIDLIRNIKVTNGV